MPVNVCSHRRKLHVYLCTCTTWGVDSGLHVVGTEEATENPCISFFAWEVGSYPHVISTWSHLATTCIYTLLLCISLLGRHLTFLFLKTWLFLDCTSGTRTCMKEYIIS